MKTIKTMKIINTSNLQKQLKTFFSLALLLSLSTTLAAEKQIHYIHNDHLGTPQLITDQNQNVVWDAQYPPFGNATVDEDVDGDGQKLRLNLRFPGQYFDAETGLHYNYYRDYDPSLGRYVQSDPIGLRGGMNTYLYANANPLRYVDPYGLRGMNSGYPYDGNAPLPDVGVTGCVGMTCASSDFGGDSTEVSLGFPELGGHIYICVPQPQGQQEAESECSKPEMEQTRRGLRRASGSSAGSPDATFSANFGKFVGFSTGEGKTCIKVGVGLSLPFSASKSNGTL